MNMYVGEFCMTLSSSGEHQLLAQSCDSFCMHYEVYTFFWHKVRKLGLFLAQSYKVRSVSGTNVFVFIVCLLGCMHLCCFTFTFNIDKLVAEIQFDKLSYNLENSL